MLLMHNHILRKTDLHSIKIDVSLNNKKKILKIFKDNDSIHLEIHPYVFEFFLEYDLVKEGMRGNHDIFYWSNKKADLKELDQEKFRSYLEAKKEEDIKNLIRLEAFFKLEPIIHLKTLKQQIRGCGIEVKQESTYRDRIITVFNQEFIFKDWGCDGKPYFRDWMKKNQLRILNNIVNSSSI